MIKLYPLIILIIFFLNACKVTNTLPPARNLSAMYNPAATTIHPQIFVYDKLQAGIDLYSIIFTNQLLFNSANSENTPMARIKIYYKIMESHENTAVLDSASKFLNIKRSQANDVLAIRFPLAKISLNKFVIQVTVTDLIRNKMNIKFIDIDALQMQTARHFYVSHFPTHQPFFSNSTVLSDTLLIEFANAQTPKIYLKKFNNDFGFPTPPYASTYTNYKIANPDTIIEYVNNQNITFTHTHRGMFYFQSDTTINEGLAIPDFGEEYPYFKSAEKLIEPLAYLCNAYEYKILTSQTTKKLAVDNFWLQTSSDSKNAKEQIRVFYSRATYANIYFTSVCEGWKTDRGMIYIVFGPPKIVNKTSEGETWIYSDNSNMKMVKFNFTKTYHPFSNNHYVLKRSVELKLVWDEAVKTWRSGKIYSFDI